MHSVLKIERLSTTFIVGFSLLGNAPILLHDAKRLFLPPFPALPAAAFHSHSTFFFVFFYSTCYLGS